MGRRDIYIYIYIWPNPWTTSFGRGKRDLMGMRWMVVCFFVFGIRMYHTNGRFLFAPGFKERNAQMISNLESPRNNIKSCKNPYGWKEVMWVKLSFPMNYELVMQFHTGSKQDGASFFTKKTRISLMRCFCPTCFCCTTAKSRGEFLPQAKTIKLPAGKKASAAAFQPTPKFTSLCKAKTVWGGL